MNEKKNTLHRTVSLKKWSFFFLLIILLTRAIYYMGTEGFSPDRICMPSISMKGQKGFYDAEKKAPPFPQGLKNTSFHYLKKGSQAYAFTSSDGKYVLKLLKRHHMQEPKWLEEIPTFGPLTKWKQILLQKRQRKLELALNSYIIATTKLRKQCGILAYQLEPSPNQTNTVELIDGIGRTYSIALESCGYILQEKASLIFDSLTSWIKKEDITSAKHALQSLIQLIIYRSKLGIHDVDPDLHKNAGFVGKEAIFIDIGSFHQSDKPLSNESFACDIKNLSKELRFWLESREKNLALFFDYAIEEAIQSY